MRQRLNILVVDDEPSVRSSLVWALRPLGHSVEIVDDGEQALAKLATNPMIDLLITDHSMPRMRGLELVRRLRDRSYRGKVVVLSAHLSQQTRAAYNSSGVDAVMRKPFDVDALRETIGELFPNPSAVL